MIQNADRRYLMNLDGIVITIGIIAVAATIILYVRNYRFSHYVRGDV